jgi:hypothetical protein
MLDDAIKTAMQTALRLHEIGDKSPYRLFFAGKGKSGGSFGFMQGDLAAGQPYVTKSFQAVLAAASVPAAKAELIVEALSVHLLKNPLSASDTKLVNDALASAKGRALVDTMDDQVLAGVYKGVNQCIAAASSFGRTIESKALIYMAMWINMSGPPTNLLKWLAGKSVSMATQLPKAPIVVSGAAMEGYLRATNYYAENPGNLPHAMQCAAAGMAGLQ